MSKYVDGYVLAVPKSNVEQYRKLSEQCGRVWKEYGALEYIECVAEDVPDGKVTSFPQAVKLKPGEVVVFSWIIYESRAKRDEVNDKVMKDPRLKDMMHAEKMPFDGMRMFWGGFETIVEL